MTPRLPDPPYGDGGVADASFGLPPACTFSDLRRTPIDWTNDAQRRLVQIEETAARIEEGIQWLLDRVEEVFSPYLKPIQLIVGDYFNIFIELFRDRINMYIELIRRTWAALRPQLEEAARCTGNPAALDDMSAVWNRYGKRLDAVAAAITLDKLATDDCWVGSGATAYVTSAQQQNIAIADLADDAGRVRDALEQHAAAIVAYDTLLDDALEGFAVAFTVAGVGAVATIVGLVAGGWPGVVIFVLAVIATAASFGVAIWAYNSAVETANTLFDQAAETQESTLTSTAISSDASWPTFASE